MQRVIVLVWLLMQLFLILLVLKDFAWRVLVGCVVVYFQPADTTFRYTKRQYRFDKRV